MSNLTSEPVHLPSGTIVATLENFDEKEFDILDWSNNLSISLKSTAKNKTQATGKFQCLKKIKIKNPLLPMMIYLDLIFYL